MEWTTHCYDTYNNPKPCDNTRGPYRPYQPVRCKPYPIPMSLPNAGPMHEKRNTIAFQHSVCSWMKLLSASRACFRFSWLTSRPSRDMSSSPILMRPSILERPGRSAFAPFHRALSVCLKGGPSGSISLLSWRTVRALSTFRNMLQGARLAKSTVKRHWELGILLR
jgi:hypothetical protein